MIAQKKNEADIRVRDGEVSLIGGLIQNQDSTTIAGIPGLANIPIIGKYFLGNTNKQKDRTNLLIAMIPHIVRSPDVTALDLRGVAAGTDQTVKLNYAPKKEEAAYTTRSGNWHRTGRARACCRTCRAGFTCRAGRSRPGSPLFPALPRWR